MTFVPVKLASNGKGSTLHVAGSQPLQVTCGHKQSVSQIDSAHEVSGACNDGIAHDSRSWRTEDDNGTIRRVTNRVSRNEPVPACDAETICPGPIRGRVAARSNV